MLSFSFSPSVPSFYLLIILFTHVCSFIVAYLICQGITKKLRNFTSNIFPLDFCIFHFLKMIHFVMLLKYIIIHDFVEVKNMKNHIDKNGKILFKYPKIISFMNQSPFGSFRFYLRISFLLFTFSLYVYIYKMFICLQYKCIYFSLTFFY